MKNKKITMYEFIGFIKDGNIPRKIKYSGYTWIYDEDYNDYINPTTKHLLLFNEYIRDYFFIHLNETVEILSERSEKDEK